MASASAVTASGMKSASGTSVGVDRLPDEMNDMKIRDDKVDRHAFSFVSLFYDAWLEIDIILCLEIGMSHVLISNLLNLHRRWKQQLLMAM